MVREVDGDGREDEEEGQTGLDHQGLELGSLGEPGNRKPEPESRYKNTLMSRLWPRFVDACSVWNSIKLEHFIISFLLAHCTSSFHRQIQIAWNLPDFYMSLSNKFTGTHHSRVPPVQEFVDSLGEEEYQAVDGEHGQDDGGECDRGEGLPYHVIAWNVLITNYN